VGYGVFDTVSVGSGRDGIGGVVELQPVAGAGGADVDEGVLDGFGHGGSGSVGLGLVEDEGLVEGGGGEAAEDGGAAATVGWRGGIAGGARPWIYGGGTGCGR